MKFANVVIAVSVLVVGTSMAHAQSVTFSKVNDGVPGRFFNAANSAPDPSNPNRLVIGFNSGTDPNSWKTNDFKASSEAFSHTTAMDTISFVVEAPEGYYISRITYTQRGTGYVVRTGRAAGAANWIVGEYAADLGVFGTNPSLTRTMDLSAARLRRVPVSISNSLFAFSTPTLGSATVSVTSADVVVELIAQ